MNDYVYKSSRVIIYTYPITSFSTYLSTDFSERNYKKVSALPTRNRDAVVGQKLN